VKNISLKKLHLQLHSGPRCSAINFLQGSQAFLWSYLIVVVIVEAITGRGIDTLLATKQKARVADTAWPAEQPTVGLGALTGCSTSTGFVVGIQGTAL
jgi:hypothetical protein